MFLFLKYVVGYSFVQIELSSEKLKIIISFRRTCYVIFVDDYVKLKTECFHTQVVSSTFKFLFHGYWVKSNLNKSCHFSIRGINTSRGFQLKKRWSVNLTDTWISWADSVFKSLLILIKPKQQRQRYSWTLDNACKTAWPRWNVFTMISWKICPKKNYFQGFLQLRELKQPKPTKKVLANRWSFHIFGV